MKIAIDNMLMSMPFVVMAAMLAQLAWLKGWMSTWWGKPAEEKTSRGYWVYVITSAMLISEAVSRAIPDDGFGKYLLTLLVLLIIKMNIERRFARYPRDSVSPPL